MHKAMQNVEIGVV